MAAARLTVPFVASERPVESFRPETNPYAAPANSSHPRPAEWYLESACQYFRGIGWVSVIYAACVIPIPLYQLLTDKSPPLGEMVGVPTMMMVMLAFVGIMIRTAMRLPRDFERLYKRARWLCIVAAAIGFPILTIPASIVMARLGKYRAMPNRP